MPLLLLSVSIWHRSHSICKEKEHYLARSIGQTCGSTWGKLDTDPPQRGSRGEEREGVQASLELLIGLFFSGIYCLAADSECCVQKPKAKSKALGFKGNIYLKEKERVEREGTWRINNS